MACVPAFIGAYDIMYRGKGYDTKAIRAIIRLRKKDPNERQEEEALIELYMTALGMA